MPSTAFFELDVVGGHEGILTDGKIVCKPMHSKRGDAEYKFYQECSLMIGRNEKSILSFLPKFHGEQIINNKQYIILDDLTLGYKNPSIMDIKIGVQAWDENASHEKVLKEASKYPKQIMLGTRFTGMRVWDKKDAKYKVLSREYGYTLKEDTFHQVFEHFLHDGISLNDIVARSFKDKLEELKKVFENQSKFRFYGSSLLFLYESGDDAVRVDLKMIDFAHVWPIEGPDSHEERDGGYLVGIDTLLSGIEQVMKIR
jgi:Inositol polyphosphate kinase